MKNYVSIPEAATDWELLGNAIHQCRGVKALNVFAIEVGYNPRSMFALANNKPLNEKRSSVKEDLLRSISEGADFRSGVTEEMLFATTGKINAEYVQALFDQKKVKLINQLLAESEENKFANEAKELALKEKEELKTRQEKDKEVFDYIFFCKSLAVVANDSEKAELFCKSAKLIYNSVSARRLVLKYAEQASETEILVREYIESEKNKEKTKASIKKLKALREALEKFILE